MYLQSLEIFGFKSFAAKTVLRFDKGVTVIVGPNGCGKSNVLDAVRWVLGEQSAKALRGGEMADVIFSGTDSRSALGMAEVSMTFADCEKDLGVEWNEVTITRRVYRDGQGQYFINRTPCRLRDIHQLFMDTGVGRSAYSIMEQGKIDQILSSRPEDRRAIFEEAAGITKFKAQRKEALKKLEATEANLVRLEDVVREVKRQIGSLQRQAAKARRYQTMVQDVRILETHNARRIYADLAGQLGNTQEALRRLHASQEQRDDDVRRHEAEVAEQRQALETLEESLTQARQNVNELRNRLTQGESRIGFNGERMAEFGNLIERYERDISTSEEKLTLQQTEMENSALELEALQQSLATEESRLTEQQGSAGSIVAERAETERRYQGIFSQITGIEGKLSSLRTEIAACITSRDSAGTRMAILCEEIEKLSNAATAFEAQHREVTEQVERNAIQLEQRREEVAEAETLVRSTQVELSELDKTLHADSRRLQERSSKLDVLRQLNADGAGFSEGTQAVLKGFDDPDFYKPAVLGALAQFIEVASAFITPIEAALGQNLQAIVMKDTMIAEAVITHLTEKKLGRASLALRQLWPEGAAPQPGSAVDLPIGAVGWAVDKVKAQPEVEPLIRRLLADMAIVENLETAVRLAGQGSGRYQYVTLSGEVLSREGILLGGQSKDAGSSVLQRKAQIVELEKEVHEIQTALAEISERRLAAVSRLEAGQHRLQEARDEAQTLNLSLGHLRTQVVNLEREGKEAARKVGIVTSERDGIARQHEEAAARVGALEEQAESAISEIADLQAQQGELSDALATLRESESLLTGELNEMRVRVATEKQRLMSLQNQRQPMEARLGELREMIEQRRRDIADYQLKREQLEEDSENVRAGMTQAQSRLGEAEESVQTLLAERTALAAQVESQESILRQTRHDLGKSHEQRTQLEVRANRVQLRLENLSEHIQRRYQIDLAEFTADYTLLFSTIQEQKKRQRSGGRTESFDLPLSAARAMEAANGEEETTEEEAAEVVASEESETVETQEASSEAPEETKAGEEEVQEAEGEESEEAEDAEETAEEEASEVPSGISEEAIDWSFVERTVKELDQKLESMGPVNIDAIQEYEELEERYTFLQQQNDDLNTSKAELLEVIAKINTTTKKLFAETFEQVRLNFQEMFKELFGGGKANLVLLDESDPLESGIEIIAKPPGKQLQSITLLSGGEKTMTAVALLFSIYMVKPSPFCVLDEMDAPLDESNINRFIKILDRFSSQSQFVVISHNKRTIARADIIYGVTMEEHGVSKLVGVKFTRREDSPSGSDVIGGENPTPVPSVAESFGKHGDLHSEREAAERQETA